MAFDASKTILLEKQYLYIKASKGFQLEGTNIERVWVNTGYYRFLVDNVAKALSNSYVKVLYDSSDIDFIAYCSDLFLEEIQNTVVVAIENLQSYVEEFYDRNHEDISELSEGLSGALQAIASVITAKPLVFYSPSTESSFHIDLSLYDSTFEFVVEKGIKAVGYNPSLCIYLDNGTNFKYAVLPDGTTFPIRGSWHVPMMCGVYKVVHV